MEVLPIINNLCANFQRSNLVPWFTKNTCSYLFWTEKGYFLMSLCMARDKNSFSLTTKYIFVCFTVCICMGVSIYLTLMYSPVSSWKVHTCNIITNSLPYTIPLFLFTLFLRLKLYFEVRFFRKLDF